MSVWRKVGEGLNSTIGFIWWPFLALGKLLFRNVTPRKKAWYFFVGVVVLSMLAFLVDWPRIPTWVPGNNFWNKYNVQLGLDLRGGSHLVYEAKLDEVASSEQGDSVEGVRDVIERRVNFFGVSEPVVQTSRVGDSWRVIVELPGITDTQEAIRLIGETPVLEFKEQSTAVPDTTEIDKYNEEAKKKAEGILKKALQGNDFAKLAQENSEDSSKDQGGDLGWFAKGVMVAPFEEAAFALKKGEVTKTLVETQFGYHIIKKTDEREGDSGPEIQASHILIRTQTPEAPSEWASTGLSGKQLKKANVEFDPNTGIPLVNITFDDEGKDLFAAITGRNIGKPVAIFLDGQPISIPTVQEEITGGQAVISGDFTLPEAKQLSQRLNSGALPVPIELISQTTVDATLGKVSVEKSLLAGILGLILVVIFMLIYYRLPGLLAVLALGVYAMLTLALFKLWPVTLTLAGIAGFILSVGMAVDANVLIFERLKEELRAGRPMAEAIEEGFRRAWTSIRDSNVSSLITAMILIWFGSSIVKGFAVTLALGILISMFTAITVSRTFLRLTATTWLSKKYWLFGISRKDLPNQGEKT
ncbi:TPA: protein translocase subunit SecD [Candidatus Veblenbacteria bacterium]|nr:protein translocase subunit SecD [Candidatus Veblenbacteria bacterium]